MENNHCDCHNRCRAEGWQKEAGAWMCKYADLKKKYDKLEEELSANKARLYRFIYEMNKVISFERSYGE